MRPAVRSAVKVAQTVAQKLLGTNGNWTFNRLAVFTKNLKPFLFEHMCTLVSNVRVALDVFAY